MKNRDKDKDIYGLSHANSTKKLFKTSYPAIWEKSELLAVENAGVVEFRNIPHFVEQMELLRKANEKSDFEFNFGETLDDLKAQKGMIDKDDYEAIYNTVRNNLIKKGLVSPSYAEDYKYHHEGLILDVAKLVERDPQCMLTKNIEYISSFYELNINLVYPAVIDSQVIKDGISRLLATITILEAEHKYCKLNLVVAVNNGCRNNDSMLMMLPLYSHNDFKSIELMSSIINEKFLRTFYFAIQDDFYGVDKVSSTRGEAVKMAQCINIWDIKEEELTAMILDQIIVAD